MAKTDSSFDFSSYSTVAERIELFYSVHPLGRIDTLLVSRTAGETIFKASVFRNLDDSAPSATGWAAEREGDGEVNTYSCLENTETSAVGRALANLGFTASTKRPSREEMERIQRAKADQNSPLERKSGERENRQSAANTVLDLLELLKDAEAAGFSPSRSNLIRQHFRSATTGSLARVRRLEPRIRQWIHRHDT
jgi:hypothetical protein